MFTELIGTIVVREARGLLLGREAVGVFSVRGRGERKYILSRVECLGPGDFVETLFEDVEGGDMVPVNFVLRATLLAEVTRTLRAALPQKLP